MTTLERVRPHLVVVNELYRQSGAESAAVSAKVSVVVRSCVCSRGSRVRWWVGIVVRFVIVCVRFVIPHLCARIFASVCLKSHPVSPFKFTHTHSHHGGCRARAVACVSRHAPVAFYRSPGVFYRYRRSPGSPRCLFTGIVPDRVHKRSSLRGTSRGRDATPRRECWTCVNCPLWTSCRARRTAMPTRIMDTGARTLASLAEPSGGVS